MNLWPLVAGLAAGSLALLAFGGDSLVELLSGFAVLTRRGREEGSRESREGKTAQFARSELVCYR